MTAPTGGAGSIVWAVSAYDVNQPLRILEHDGSETRFDNATDLAGAVNRRERAGEFEIVIGAKLRPVLLLQDRPVGRIEDFAALRLIRVEKFAPAEQEAIRREREETLFYLGHDKSKYGIDKEYAVALTSLHRVHRTAIVGKAVGAVDKAEFRTICERLVKISELDLSNLIVRRAGELVAQLKRRATGV